MKSLNLGRLQTKLEFSINLLRLLSFVQQKNPYPKIPENIASLCKGKSYSEVWKLLIQDSCFTILLQDYSFFLFRFDKSGSDKLNMISMSYYGCPYDFISIEDYIVENYGEEYLEFKYNYEIQTEYEEALNDSPPVEYPVMFRYDYSPDLYHPARHPASHLHIGFQNEIRIGCERILDPLSFTAFVLRHQYPEIWANKAVPTHKAIFQSSIRESLPLVPGQYISEHDKLEMYLH